MSTEDDPRDETLDRESRAALMAGILAVVLVLFLTVMALMMLNPVGSEVSAVSSALSG